MSTNFKTKYYFLQFLVYMLLNKRLLTYENTIEVKFNSYKF